MKRGRRPHALRERELCPRTNATAPLLARRPRRLASASRASGRWPDSARGTPGGRPHVRHRIHTENQKLSAHGTFLHLQLVVDGCGDADEGAGDGGEDPGIVVAERAASHPRQEHLHGGSNRVWVINGSSTTAAILQESTNALRQRVKQSEEWSASQSHGKQKCAQEWDLICRRNTHPIAVTQRC